MVEFDVEGRTFVQPAILSSSLLDVHIDPAAVRIIRGDESVASTGWFYGRQVPYGSRTVRVAATDVKTLLDEGIISV